MSENAIRVQAAATVVETPGSSFGPSALRITLLMARVTFREAARRKILWIATLAGIVFLAFFWTALHFLLRNAAQQPNTVSLREGIVMMTMMVLYAGSMMTSLMAVLTCCDTLAGEISSGTIHAIATKPVERWCLVLGKWVGFVGMLTLYVALIEGGTIFLSWLQSGYLAHHVIAVISLVWLQAVVLLSVTMAASTSFSSLTSGAVSLGLYGLAFVGGWIEQFGALRHVHALADLGILSSLIMPSDALWRRAAYVFQPPLLGSVGASPFVSDLVPSNAMVVYAAFYAMLAVILAQVLFSRRDL
jgi:Cu-processing system permease protein